MKKRSKLKKDLKRPLIISIVIVILSTIAFSVIYSKNYKSNVYVKAAENEWLSGMSAISDQAGASAWRGASSPITITGCWDDREEADQRNLEVCRNFSNFPGSIDMAVGALARGSGESWAQAATGAYDARWRAALGVIDSTWGSKRTVFIRFAHEFNGDWYDWRVNSSNYNEFNTAFRRFYGLVQSELVAKGRDAKVVWCPNEDSSNIGVSVTQMWPGDQYVDVVGVDSYDWWPPRTEANWESELNMTGVGVGGDPSGLESWRQFALAHGKPMAIPEWGTNAATISDSPFYIRKMNEYMTQHAGTGPGQIWYDVYFNEFEQTRLYPSSNVPQSASMYRSLTWGRAGNGSSNPNPTAITPRFNSIGDCATNGICPSSPVITQQPVITQPPVNGDNGGNENNGNGDNGNNENIDKGTNNNKGNNNLGKQGDLISIILGFFMLLLQLLANLFS